MAISYPLSLPTAAGIRAVRLIARNTVAVTTSPFTYKQQVLKHSGERWEADVTLPPMNRTDAEEWNSFLLSLGGQYGTFLLGDPNAATPRGSARNADSILVNGASQTGNSLIIDGCTVSQTGYLKAGDYIQIGTGADSQLYKVLADVDSDSGGNASIDIWPSLRSSPADNAAIYVESAKGLFRLASSDTSWDINEVGFYGITFGAVEAI